MKTIILNEEQLSVLTAMIGNEYNNNEELITDMARKGFEHDDALEYKDTLEELLQLVK